MNELIEAGTPLAGVTLNRAILGHLIEILDGRQLFPVFQPIIDIRSGEIAGYEGLIRGPIASPLHAPLNLFKAASLNGMTVQLEKMCQQVVQDQFLEMGLPGRLFLNVSLESLLQAKGSLADRMLLGPQRIIMELTENQPTYDYRRLIEAASRYRELGCQIAIDDLGEGFSSLRLWSELRPEFVKIDKHFIQRINQDPVKLHFVRSIQEIASNSGSLVIAEGIETRAELLAVKDLGIGFGQGYFIAYPQEKPETALSESVSKTLGQSTVPVYSSGVASPFKTVTATRLLKPVLPVSPQNTNDEVLEIFHAHSDLQAVPVVSDDVPVGIINRSLALERYAHRYWRELHGRKACSSLMDAEPVVVDKDMSIQKISSILVNANHRHMANGFIVTDQGKYAGIGNGRDLMAEITKLQIETARYANPLTQLPGNVPINEHIDRLLQAGGKFAACYCDLDHFKPFNDVYGYRRGDEVIYLLSQILVASCNPDHDFVGHIGGDDFVILFQSEDWETCCGKILDTFTREIRSYFDGEDLERGGYLIEDRQGNKVFCPLTGLSLGVVLAEPGEYASHNQISAAMAEAKKQAKKMPGSSLFVERRRLKSILQ
jgi:diguanylate cyclase (GGDEF)-like protein